LSHTRRFFLAEERPQSSVCRVRVDGDHHIIETDARRASAILQVLAGATLQEVGDQLGVTRERIRQYMVQAGLPTNIRLRQSPETQRMARFRENHRGRRHQAAKARTKERVRQGGTWIRGFVQAYGRPPIIEEVTLALMGRVAAAASLCSWLHTRSGRQRRRYRWVRVMYRLGGVIKIPRGINAHRDGGVSSTAAKLAGMHRYWDALTPDERRVEANRRFGQ
jgi:sigma-70-like protein